VAHVSPRSHVAQAGFRRCERRKASYATFVEPLPLWHYAIVFQVERSRVERFRVRRSNPSTRTSGALPSYVGHAMLRK